MFPAVGDDLGHPVGRDGDDREVDLLADPAHGAVGGHPLDRAEVVGERRVHRVRASGEAGAEEIAQHGPADAAGRTADADDGDGSGGQQALDRTRFGALFAGALDGERLGGGFQVEGEVDGAVLEAALLGEPGVPEHFDHLVVGGQHLGGEAADAPLPGHRGDVFEEGRGHPAALVGVLHEEGDLRLVRRGGGGPAPVVDPVVADGGDELAADRDGQPHPVDVVVMGEAVHVPGGETWIRGEEAVVLRLVGHLLVEADQPLGVVRGDGPDARGATVAEHHVRLPVVGVRVMRTLLRSGLHGQSLRPGARVAAGR